MVRKRIGAVAVGVAALALALGADGSSAAGPLARPAGFITTTLTVSTAGTGGGTVSSGADGKINCPGDCSESYVVVSPSGEPVTLTAKALSGSVFVGWKGDCSGTGPCSLTTASSHSVAAVFDLIARTVLVEVSGSGGQVQSSPAGIACPSTCTAKFPNGTKLTLTSVVRSGVVFAGWVGPCTGTADCRLTVTSDVKVGAVFKSSTSPPPSPPPSGTTITLTLSVTSGAGRVTSSPSGINCLGPGTACSFAFAANAVVLLTATADSGFTIARWGGACSSAGATATCKLSLTSPMSASIAFQETPVAAPQPVQLTVIHQGNGKVTSSPGGIDCGSVCTTSLPPGTAFVLKATPDPGFLFAGWSATGGPCDGTTIATCSWQISTAAKAIATFVSAGSTPSPPPSPPPPPPTGGGAQQLLDVRVLFRASWVASVFRGSVSVEGRTSKAGKLSVKLTLAKRITAGAASLDAVPAPVSLNVAVPGGDFARTLRLPPNLLPGRYEVVVSIAGSQETRRGLILLPPPPEGVAARAVVSTTQNGPAAATLPHGSKKVFVRFDLATQPRLGPITVTWTRSGGKVVATVRKGNAPTITTFLLARDGLPRGSWNVVLKAGGKVVKTAPFRIA